MYICGAILNIILHLHTASSLQSIAALYSAHLCTSWYICSTDVQRCTRLPPLCNRTGHRWSHCCEWSIWTTRPSITNTNTHQCVQIQLQICTNTMTNKYVQIQIIDRCTGGRTAVTERPPLSRADRPAELFQGIYGQQRDPITDLNPRNFQADVVRYPGTREACWQPLVLCCCQRMLFRAS